MSNANAAKGQRWEKAIVDFLSPFFGRAVVRPRQEGYLDVGDIHISPFIIQAKDHARLDFSGFVDDAELQASHAGEPYGVAVVKRRGQGSGRAYVVHSLASFTRVVIRLRRAESLLLRASPAVFDEHMAAVNVEARL